MGDSRVLVIRVEVSDDVDPTLIDPLELALYIIDSAADDPVPKVLDAQWESA